MLVEVPCNQSIWFQFINHILVISFICRKGTDIVWRYTEEGKRVRVSVDSGKVIPKPPWERNDFKSKDAVPGKVFITILFISYMDK